MLDAWRGIAAAVVVLSHIAGTGLGYQAVLLFFVISGYCITASMDACLEGGMGFRAFMSRRIRRIYPPYLLAVALFVFARGVRAALMGDSLHWPMQVWIQNLTLTQWLSLLARPVALPAANPTLFVDVFWSLCYEEQFYFVIALLMLVPTAGTRLRVLSGLMILGLAWMVLMPRVCHGVFIEYWPEFGIGSLLFYRLCRMPTRAPRMACDIFLLALAARAGSRTVSSRRNPACSVRSSGSSLP